MLNNAVRLGVDERIDHFSMPMQLDEVGLREQLRDVVIGDILGVELINLSNRSGEGYFKTTREYLIHMFTARMRGAQEDSKPERAAVFRRFIESIQFVTDDEPIYLWMVIQEHRRVRGYSTPRRLIGVVPDGFYKINIDE